MLPESEGATAVAQQKPGRPKKQSGSETRKHGTLVRMADDVVADAKALAGLEGTSAAEIMSESLRPILKRRLDEWAKKRLEGK